jgi:hypothetical protein
LTVRIGAIRLAPARPSHPASRLVTNGHHVPRVEAGRCRYTFVSEFRKEIYFCKTGSTLRRGDAQAQLFCPSCRGGNTFAQVIQASYNGNVPLPSQAAKEAVLKQVSDASARHL